MPTSKAMRASSLAEQIAELNDPAPKGLLLFAGKEVCATNAVVQILTQKM